MVYFGPGDGPNQCTLPPSPECQATQASDPRNPIHSADIPAGPFSSLLRDPSTLGGLNVQVSDCTVLHYPE